MQTSDNGSEIIAARLRHEISISNAQRGRPYAFSLSVGHVYHDSKSPVLLENMMAKADKEMYERKRSKQGAGGAQWTD